jgi:murein DD-endopeptidase MepM/ murein hydrolase activator NlpD
MRPITFICALAATLQLLSGTSLASGWTWPIRGPVITPYLNGDDPYARGQHRGVDIAAPMGSRVVAATAGTVTFAGVVGSAGLVVSERTADGRFDLSYLHLSSLSVRRGESVAEGAAVGAVGTSGQRSAEAPHLHFGVRDAGARSSYRDPLGLLGPPPAADSPRPAPAPAPAPVGHAVAGDPAPAPAGHPALADPAPAASPVRSPAAAPATSPGLPSGAHVPSLVPSGALARVAAPSAVLRRQAGEGLLPHVLAPPPAAAAVDRAGRHADRLEHVQSGKAAAAGPHGGGASSVTSQHAHAARAAGDPHHGINVGWLAACIGLVALATALGHPDGARRATARGRAAAAGRGRAAATRSRNAAAHGLATLLRPAQRGGPSQ